MDHIELETEQPVKSKLGRKPKPIEYYNVEHNSASYVVGVVIHNDSHVKFVIDKDDEEKVKQRHWHVCSGGKYIGSHVMIDNKRKELYLHNYIMNRLTFPGKGSTETVDHINRNGFDNRKANLRIVNQTEQNINQSTRERKCTLPEGCGIEPSELPRHIWYIKANGLHGDRFGIDLKTEGIKWKTSSSKIFSLREKLEQAKKKLEEYYELYPYLRPELEPDTTDYQAICLTANTCS
jgi:hypothetical protein